MAKYISPIHKAVIPEDYTRNLGTISAGKQYNSSLVNLTTLPIAILPPAAFVADVTINYTTATITNISSTCELSGTVEIDSKFINNFRFVKFYIKPNVQIINKSNTKVSIELNIVNENGTFSKSVELMELLALQNATLLKSYCFLYDTRTNALTYKGKF